MKFLEGVFRLAFAVSFLPLIRDHNLPALIVTIIWASLWALVAYINHRRANRPYPKEKHA